MGLAATSNRDRNHGTDSQSPCRTHPDRQETSDHHRGHNSSGPDGVVSLFRRHGRLVESSVSKPAGVLRTDGSLVRIDQGFISCGGPGESAGYFLPMLEVY